ncbi:MAG: sigma-54-dependent Fis family transcriptional regulator [Bacteroidales bacterium]|nr:sigma-54-dependent Fis family transcriptional regulator [Bacteroidales bacterium]
MKKAKILIADDNSQILESLRLLLKNEFEFIETIRNPNLIPEKLRKSDFDIILLDMNFAAGRTTGNEGIFWLNEILKTDPFAVVILITAFGDIELAVRGIKEGATDFICKPWDTEKLLTTLNTAYQLRKSKTELNRFKSAQKQLNADTEKNIFFGNSQAIQKIYQTLDKVACTDANVLILGENGTGKEMIAREIHNKSPRADRLFLGVDLGAISESLFESEMFGHVKGAFTDAKEDRAGRFEAASGGTLFLDEIGNLSLSLQSKLLTALQTRKITRIGSHKTTDVDFRLICATNRNLTEMVHEGLFREDLYYRVNTICIDLPPLRERKEDISGFAGFFLKHFACKYNKYNIGISESGYNALKAYTWPGNIRELKHTIEKAVILAGTGTLEAEDFYLSPHAGQKEKIYSSHRLEDIEARAISEALRVCGGNMSKAAQMLDISRTTLYSKIEKYKL